MREPAIVSKCVRLALTGLLMLPAAYPPAAEATVSGRNAPAPTATGGRSDQAAQEHRYRLNPSPRQGYEVAVTVQGAPGPMVLLGGSVSFQAAGCSYVVSSWAGARAQPEAVVPVTFVRLAGNTFVGTVYRDQLLDADYFGNGVCHWDITGVAAGFSATGDPAEASFSASLSLSQLLSTAPVVLNYLKRNYGRRGVEISPIYGLPTLESVLPEHRGEVFTIILTAKSLP